MVRTHLEKMPESEYVSAMDTFIWYVLPLALIGLTFALKPLRVWLESCASDAVDQNELVETYQQSASRFLRLSDPQKHAEARQVVVWTGRHMLNGTRLIRFLLTNGRRRTVTDSDVHADADSALSGLSTDARHAFARALGSALLASSYQSIFFGRRYRSILMWMLTAPEREVKEPEQIVYRYRKAASLDTKSRSYASA